MISSAGRAIQNAECRTSLSPLNSRKAASGLALAPLHIRAGCAYKTVYNSKTMDDTTALHTAARRYCQQRFSDWIQTYKDLQSKQKWQVNDLFQPGWDYSEKAYRTFPRYRVARAIQVEVERLKPDCE